jgi:MFS transporter, FSR family, fosmidomycin resistance protein
MTSQSAKDVKIIGLVSLAHLCSHLTQIAPAPLFLVLRQEFDVSYAALGMMISVFYGVSGVFQAWAGTLVDRFGARRLLLAGLVCLAAGIALMATAPSFWMMIVAAIVAGIGNSVFHPSDLAILSTKVSQGRLGRAFSAHAMSGTIGYGVGALLVGTLAEFVSWRWALGAVVIWILTVLAIVGVFGAELETRERARASAGPASIDAGYLAVVGNTVVISAFCYFTLMAAATTGVNGFGATALTQLFDLRIALASSAITAYVIGQVGGIFCGGFLADRTTRHDLVAMAGLTLSGLFLLFVLAAGPGFPALIMSLAIAGFAGGVTGPSRDILVRRIAPSGRSGRVFGFVYSGFDIGSAAIPLLCGMLLDHNLPTAVFVSAAALMFIAVVTVPQFRRAPMMAMQAKA